MKDLVKCCNCDFKGLIEVGTEKCPSCNKEGMLSWIDNNFQEVEDDFDVESICKIGNGTLINGDNLEIMNQYNDNYFDNCISDFPYDLAFMGRKWDTYSNFYDWCKQRAEGLHRIVKHGGYVLIFGHHKTNHRMKCAFEDAGFKIVEEIDWCYSSGFPKNQDISKMLDKDANVVRQGTGEFKTRHGGGIKSDKISQLNPNWKETEITLPTSDLAKQFSGFKTSGLKPAKEIITVFQKPLKGKYIDNIKEYGCGGMNIDACRVPTNETITNHSRSQEASISKGVYGDSKEQETHQTSGQVLGRFPSNIIFDNTMGGVLNEQSGHLKSGSNCVRSKVGSFLEHGGLGKAGDVQVTYGDEGGASRFFLNIDNENFVPFLYCSKPTKKEKGDYCNHITVKPKKLIKWLIKLVTPINGKSLDITAGSGTHGLSCEELNNEGYNIEWVNIEMMNTEDEPYFEIAKKRIENSIK
jgi:site-specific DNA-methyltransferase (adenine-specific)